MASIQQRNGTYNAHFKVWSAAKEKWIWTAKSTRTGDPEAAQRIANELQEIALKAHEVTSSTMLREHAERTVNSILQISGRSPIPTAPTLGAFSEHFLAVREPVVAAKTLGTYRMHLRALWEALGDAKRLDELTPASLLGWYRALAESRTVGVANATLKTARSMFDLAQREGHLTRNPAASIQTAKANRLQREPFSRYEVGLIVNRCRETSNDGALWLAAAGLCLGARIRDCARLRVSAFSATEDGGLLCTWVPAKTKDSTGKAVTLPVLEPLLTIAKGLLKGRSGDEFVLPSLAAMKGSALSALFTDVCEDVGIEGCQLKEVGAGKMWRSKSHHSLRHTMNQWLQAAGADRETRKDLLGQTSDSANAIYSTPQLERLADFMARALG